MYSAACAPNFQFPCQLIGPPFLFAVHDASYCFQGNRWLVLRRLRIKATWQKKCTRMLPTPLWLLLPKLCHCLSLKEKKLPSRSAAIGVNTKKTYICKVRWPGGIHTYLFSILHFLSYISLIRWSNTFIASWYFANMHNPLLKALFQTFLKVETLRAPRHGLCSLVQLRHDVTYFIHARSLRFLQSAPREPLLSFAG